MKELGYITIWISEKVKIDKLTVGGTGIVVKYLLGYFMSGKTVFGIFSCGKAAFVIFMVNGIWTIFVDFLAVKQYLDIFRPKNCILSIFHEER